MYTKIFKTDIIIFIANILINVTLTDNYEY
jgi:hypothetical protein